MVVAAAAPLGVIGGGVPLGVLVGNGAGCPPMYVVAAVVLFFFRRPWHTIVAPSLGLLGLALALVLLVDNLPLLMGGSTALGLGAGVLLAVALAAGWALAAARPRAARSFTVASLPDSAPRI